MATREELEPLNDSYLNGNPYYCDECGLGFGEFIACEEGYCRLESKEAAQTRLAKAWTKLP